MFMILFDPPESWSAILKQEGKNSIRKTKYDSIMIGLLVDAKHKSRSKMEDGTAFIHILQWMA